MIVVINIIICVSIGFVIFVSIELLIENLIAKDYDKNSEPGYPQRGIRENDING